jgi:hypothetical protein
MRITHFEAIMGALVAILTTLGFVASATRWIYRQGAASAKLIGAIEQNTTATAKLNASYEAFTVKVADSLLDHERRITRLESRK